MQEGSRALREAASLAPENKEVKAAFVRIQADDSTHVLITLCRKFAEGQEDAIGNEALKYLQANGSGLPASTAEQCVHLMIHAQDLQESVIRDDIVSSLLKQCLAARAYLAKQLHGAVTGVFEEVYGIGDGSAIAMTTVVLDPAAWSEESVRDHFEKDVFQLFLAKLMECGTDYDGRAMKGISKLMAVNPEKFLDLIDEEIFETFLLALDNRLNVEIRSQATLAIAKYFELSREKAQSFSSNFVTKRVALQTSEDLVVAFSAAAAVFPIAPSMASALFLTQGFVPSLVLLLEKRAKSPKVMRAALDMLNAACIDGTCRESISKNCSDWLHKMVEIADAQRRGEALVILAKTRSSIDSENGAPNGAHVGEVASGTTPLEIVPMLRNMLLEPDGAAQRNAIEGLAYTSMKPKVKEDLCKDVEFLKKLLHLSDPKTINATTVFGSLTLIDNLTQYLPHLSEEQKRMAQLKAYANASKDSAKPDHLDDDSHVDNRCGILLQAGAVPYLVTLHKVFLSSKPSQVSLGLLTNIMLSLSRTPTSRGVIAQQGGIPLLLQIYKQLSSVVEPQKVRQLIAHALARILISVDPGLALSSRSRSSVIPPLISLLDDSTFNFSDGPRDLLPTFEALLALTNLVSNPGLDTAPEIIRSAFDKVEDLLLSSNVLLRRAATELVCNLMTAPAGIEKFADGSRAATRRLHILVALTDAEDVSTRRAAGGALAMMTDFADVVDAILKRDRGVDILLRLCEDEDAGCVHRGVVCIRNIVLVEGVISKKSKEEVKRLDGVEILKGVLRNTKDQAILEVCVEALKSLVSKDDA